MFAALKTLSTAMDESRCTGSFSPARDSADLRIPPRKTATHYFGISYVNWRGLFNWANPWGIHKKFVAEGCMGGVATQRIFQPFAGLPRFAALFADIMKLQPVTTQLGAIWFRSGKLRCRWRVVVDQMAT
jgi:hypothetical protein